MVSVGMFDISIRMPNFIGQRAGTNSRKFSFFRDKRISRYKVIEAQIDYFGWGQLFNVSVKGDWSGCDHATVGVELIVLGIFLSIGVYDTRHWDYDANRYEEN